MINTEDEKRRAGFAAAREVESGQLVGLGTGSTAVHFVTALAARMKDEGLTIRGVATSRATADLARSLGIQLVPLPEVTRIDVLADGADRVDPELHMVKGGGGALLWEKLAASVARRRIYMVDGSKRVPQLGRDFPVPVEVVAAGLGMVREELHGIGLDPRLRTRDGAPFVTDSGNVILDCYLPEGASIPRFEKTFKSIIGVVESGLFVDLVDTLLVGTRDGVERIDRPVGSGVVGPASGHEP